MSPGSITRYKSIDFHLVRAPVAFPGHRERGPRSTSACLPLFRMFADNLTHRPAAAAYGLESGPFHATGKSSSPDRWPRGPAAQTRDGRAIVTAADVAKRRHSSRPLQRAPNRLAFLPFALPGNQFLASSLAFPHTIFKSAISLFSRFERV